MIHIVENNHDFIVVNKPPGISIQRENDQPGLLQRVADQVGSDKLLPVHRLDKVTSGLILMAHHGQANRELAEQFAQRRVEKFYIALGTGKPKKKQGAIIGDMEKARRSAWKLLPSKTNPAITRFFSQSLRPGVRAFLLKPETGKTHQIRVALKSIGSPILGDALYGGDLADRTYLHAYELAFTFAGIDYRFQSTPTVGEAFTGEAMAECLAGWREPSALDWPTG